jgi:hypothetical protein
MNELLLWMSARRFGSQQSLRARIAEFEPRGLRVAGEHRRVEWNLSKLGHAEFGAAADQAGWRIAPPVLAAGDYGAPCSAVLCGARTPRMLELLAAQAAPVAVAMHTQPSSPDRVAVCTPGPRALADLAAKIGLHLQWNAPLAILMAVTPPKLVGLDKVMMPLGAWTVSRFSKSKLDWDDSSVREASSAAAGLFRFRADRQRTAYVLVENHVPYACDPANGKFRILRRRNRAISYDHRSMELTIRVTCRPPELVERALVLCSGELPSIRDGHIIYSNVARAVAAGAAHLLGQRLS